MWPQVRVEPTQRRSEGACYSEAMRASLLLVVVFLSACVETVATLDDGTRGVTVLPPLTPPGPSCEERCQLAAQVCPPYDLAGCVAGCSDARNACLEAAQFDCVGVARCLLPAPSRPFSPGPYGTEVKSIAGPVTLPTARGDWRFDLEWTGEDSYLFLFLGPGTGPLFQGALRPLLAASPRNVHYVFGHFADQLGFDQARARWTTELSQLSAADQLHWTNHVHFVSAPLASVPGWVSRMMAARAANPPRYLGNGLTAFGIDRFQRIREVGMLGRLGSSGVIPDLALLANEAKAFEFEFAREARLAAQQQVEVVTLATAQTAHDTIDVDVTLPGDLSRFDTLEVDLTLDCPQHQSSECGAWDYLSHLRLCEPATGADGGATWSCTQELARWITTYWREGRWVTDISAQLATLAAAGGGTKHLRWTANGQWDPRTTDYIVSLSLRFSASGRGMRPVSATPLWTGGDWNAGYDATKPPVMVDVPADAKKVELVTLTTGHGGVQPTNCAEFCNHQHLFTVNGVLHRQSFPEAQTANTCAARVDVGVVPNQHGTWYYGRGGWCPGQDVAPWVVDVTADVVKGQANTLTYRTEFNGAPVGANLGNIVLSSWLVVWK